MKTEDFLRDLGIKDRRVTVSPDDLEIVAEIEEIDRSLQLGDDPTQNDDYIISFTTEEDRLLFLYVDMHSLEAYIYEEYSNFEVGIKEEEVAELVEEYGRDIVENFIEDNYIIALDDAVINLDDYQEIYKKWSDNAQGNNTIYYSEEKDNFFIDSGKYSNDGVWCSIEECFEYLYGNNITPNDKDIGNQIFEIDKEEYFEFCFEDLDIEKIDDDFKIVVRVPMHDSFTGDYFMDLETQETYISRMDSETGIYYNKAIEISFNCAYIGSADGEDVFYVEKDIVIKELGEKYSFEEFTKEFEHSEKKEWNDYLFMSISDFENYVVKYENRFIDFSDFDSNCEAYYVL